MSPSAAKPPLIPITLPQPDRFTGQMKVTNWLIDIGDEVIAGDRLLEVLSPGILFIVDAPVDGRLKEIVVPVDGSLTATTTLGWIEPAVDS
ncbi:Biotin-requiring enzyme [Polystyrenella longa]|uniref:Biotin-requiring enzyme n=1 Tax=Polystyrenella longa TaxID=2528007 RepID=A0A518CM43_9PLAN|nr:biotin/lipoyl-containing protein [Polystyrenella longa]QDU80297.1 Biotin-requiring enzyme [Polystyrenella longa]